MKITNPHSFELFIHAIGRRLGIGETVDLQKDLGLAEAEARKIAKQLAANGQVLVEDAEALLREDFESDEHDFAYNDEAVTDNAQPNSAADALDRAGIDHDLPRSEEARPNQRQLNVARALKDAKRDGKHIAESGLISDPTEPVDPEMPNVDVADEPSAPPHTADTAQRVQTQQSAAPEATEQAAAPDLELA